MGLAGPTRACTLEDKPNEGSSRPKVAPRVSCDHSPTSGAVGHHPLRASRKGLSHLGFGEQLARSAMLSVRAPMLEATSRGGAALARTESATNRAMHHAKNSWRVGVGGAAHMGRRSRGRMRDTLGTTRTRQAGQPCAVFVRALPSGCHNRVLVTTRLLLRMGQPTTSALLTNMRFTAPPSWSLARQESRPPCRRKIKAIISFTRSMRAHSRLTA